MKLSFIVDWGYRHIYFDEEFLPRLCFDGNITVANGALTECKRVVFAKDRFGTHVLTPTYIPYGESSWKSEICNSYDGFLFTVEGDESTLVEIVTDSGNAKFSLQELSERKHLVFNTDNPYSFAVLHAYLKDTEWYLAKQKENEIRILGKQFDGAQNTFFGVNGVVVPCGKTVSARFDFCQADEDLQVDGAIRFIHSASAEKDEPINGVADFEILINGKSVYRNAKFSCNWDDHSQHFEESFFTVPTHILKATDNLVQIVNHDGEKVILAQMARLFVKNLAHLQILSCPKWTVKGKVFPVKLYAKYPVDLAIQCGGAIVCTPSGETAIQATRNNILDQGENEYFFKTSPSASGKIELVFTDKKRGVESRAFVEVWEGEREEIEPKTGIEIKLDAPETYDCYLRMMIDGQMGNYAIFRRYCQWNPRIEKVYDIASACNKYGVYTDIIAVGSTVKSWLSEAVVDGSAEWNFAVGDHESTGLFYWGEYFDNDAVETVDQAESLSIQELKEICDGLRTKNAKVAMGDASGGARYAYRAGFDILRHETFVSHHLALLPDARGAANAYRKPVWAAHVASQHNYQGELENAVGRYWLGMYLPWVFGSNLTFEEDSLFQNNKYYRMVNDDYTTAEKQRVTAEFYKHIQTHARLGKPQVDIAFIQGRYEAPFTAISTCNAPLERKYKGADRRVWGKHGSPKSEWGHCQPEKGMHLLETVAPKIYLPPLRQDAYRARRLFSANPYGEWDFLPIEAPADVYAQYKLAVMLGWNTMEEECDGAEKDGAKNDYERLLRYTEQGGVILLTLPQLTTRKDREFLSDLENAKLYHGGDFSDLFGVRIKNSGEEFSGKIAAVNFPKKNYAEEKDLIRLPSDGDGACRLAETSLLGGEVCLADEESGKPILVRKKVGKGYAYLLCAYAYFGHEKLKYIAVNILETLIGLHARKEVFVQDSANAVYWSEWKNGKGGKLYLLNTDWTVGGNEKTVGVVCGELRFDCAVKEREILEVSYQKGGAVYAITGDLNIVADGEDDGVYRLYGFGEATLCVVVNTPVCACVDGVEIAKMQAGKNALSLRLNGKAILKFE